MSERAVEKLRSVAFQQKIEEFINDHLLKELDTVKRLKDVFDGQLVKLLSQNASLIIEELSRKTLTFLNNERGNLRDLAKREARKQKGYKIINWVLDVDGSLDKIVDHVFSEAIPTFIAESKQDLQDVFKRLLNDLGDCRVGEIGLDLTRDGIKEIVRVLLSKDSLAKHLRVLAGGTIESLAVGRIQSLLGVVGIRNLADLLRFFDVELEMFRTRLAKSLSLKEAEVIEQVSIIVGKILDETILAMPLNLVLQGIASEDLETVVDRVIKELHRSKACQQVWQQLIEGLIQYAKIRDIDQVLNIDHLADDVSALMDSLLKNGKLMAEFQSIVNSAVRTVVSNLNSVLPKETKDFVATVAVNSMTASVEKHFYDLISSL